MKYIVFSDLDGTLLDRDTYSWQEAREAIELLREKGIPLVICTSKTRAEIEEFRKEISNTDPFISENGGAIFIPRGYFEFAYDFDRAGDKYQVIELGTPHEKLIAALNEIKLSGIEITTFHDMTVHELSRDTGLTEHEAELAKRREYDSAFRAKPEYEKIIDEAIRRKGLKSTHGGRYSHIMGDSDKGEAVRMLSRLFAKQDKTVTIGLGDSENDFAMLDSVDMPYLVQKKDGSYSSQKYNKADGIGPVGWNRVIKGVFNE